MVQSIFLKTKWNISDTELASIRRRFGGIDSNEVIGRLHLSKLLKKYQTHGYSHAKTCIKTKQNKDDIMCRFKFPATLSKETDFDESKKIVLQHC